MKSINKIYDQAILNGGCKCDTKPFSLNDKKNWFDSYNDSFPIYTVLSDKKIIGYTYFTAYRSGRMALIKAAEISCYIDFDFHAKGIGSKILSFMTDKASLLGFNTLIAIVLECNTKSIALLKKSGFEQWGCLPGIAYINGNYIDHLYFGKHI